MKKIAKPRKNRGLSLRTYFRKKREYVRGRASAVNNYYNVSACVPSVGSFTGDSNDNLDVDPVINDPVGAPNDDFDDDPDSDQNNDNSDADPDSDSDDNSDADPDCDSDDNSDADPDCDSYDNSDDDPDCDSDGESDYDLGDGSVGDADDYPDDDPDDDRETDHVNSDSDDEVSGSSTESSRVNFKKSFIDIVQSYPGLQRKFVNQLLKLFRSSQISELKDLNLDIRSLLKTPRKIDTHIVEPGLYYHFGLKFGISQNIKFIKNHKIENLIEIDINVDGLPISNSSKKQFWPILGYCHHKNEKSNVFVIGLYCGDSKPVSFNDYFQKFSAEYIDANKNGIVIGSKVFKIAIRCIICDTPARSFLMCTKGHSGYFSCNYCWDKGVSKWGSIQFGRKVGKLYTDSDFLLKLNKNHHLGTSILEDMNIQMVSQLPLDYMHLVLEGVTKNLLTRWFVKSGAPKLSSMEINKFDTEFLSYRQFICKEFQRKNRTIRELCFWKATEYRQFLLYTGPIILCHFLPTDSYNHFLLLHFGIRILCSPNYFAYNTYAETLLHSFVTNCTHLYDNFISFNTHGLLHLASCSKKLGPLDSFSCFVFESFLYTLKKLISKSNKQMEQVILRIHEKQNYKFEYNKNKEHCLKFPIKNTEFYKTFFMPNGLRFDSDSLSDGVCVLKNNKVLKIKYFEYSSGDISVYGSEFLGKTFFFQSFEDSDTEIYEKIFPTFSFLSIDNTILKFSVKEIKNKCFCVFDDIKKCFITTEFI